VAVNHGNYKSCIEHHIDFMRKIFIAARRFADVENLNAQPIAYYQVRVDRIVEGSPNR